MAEGRDHSAALRLKLQVSATFAADGSRTIAVGDAAPLDSDDCQHCFYDTGAFRR